MSEALATTINNPNTDRLFEVEQKNREFISAVLYAESIVSEKISALLARGGRTTEIDETISQLPDETERHAAEMFLCSTEMVRSSVFHDKYGEGSKARNDLNHNLIVRFNRAIREVMLDADNTTIREEQLVGSLIGFARKNALIDNKKQAQDYHNELTPVIRGMHAEQKVINLMCVADIRNYDATTDEDKKGIDIFVKHKSGKGFYGVDVKNSWGGVVGCAEEAGSDSKIYEFSLDGKKELHTWDKPARGYADAPVIHVIPHKNGFAISVENGESYPPGLLASTKFNSGDTDILELIRQARQFMDEHVDEKEKQIEDAKNNDASEEEIRKLIENSVTLYHMEKNRFIPSDLAVKTGEIALRTLKRVTIDDNKKKMYNGKPNGRNFYRR